MDETNESVYEACKAFGLRANGDLFARMNGNYLKWKRGEERERERERERDVLRKFMRPGNIFKRLQDYRSLTHLERNSCISPGVRSARQNVRVTVSARDK